MSRIEIFDRRGSISIRQDKDKHTAYISITPVTDSGMFGGGSSIVDRSLNSLLTKGISLGSSDWMSEDPHQWFARSSTSGKSLYAHMPVTGVHISQGVDMTIAKTLSDDFLVSAFGDMPVRIILSGVNFYGGGTDCRAGFSTIQKQQVLDFYEENKLSASSRNRVDLSITPASAPKSGTFRCALIGMETMNPLNEQEAVIPAYSYKLQLIGVRR